jgi:hypothetical protein
MKRKAHAIRKKSGTDEMGKRNEQMAASKSAGI